MTKLSMGSITLKADTSCVEVPDPQPISKEMEGLILQKAYEIALPSCPQDKFSNLVDAFNTVCENRGIPRLFK